MGTWWKDTRPMWCDQIVAALNLFLPNNTYFLISVVPFKACTLGLYAASPVITPLLKAFFEVHCFDSWQVCPVILLE